MPPDAQALKSALRWLEYARTDLHVVKLLGTQELDLAGPVLFHCQQAVEKVFKALIALHDQPLRKTHDLNYLGQCCAELEPELAGLCAEAGVLTDYAVAGRYWDDFADDDPLDMAWAYAFASQVLAKAQLRIEATAND